MSLKDDKALIDKLNDDIEKNQGSFDQAKLTLSTAGLLVALSLNAADYKAISLYGHSVYKATLLLIAGTALFTILGYVAQSASLGLIHRQIQAMNDDSLRPGRENRKKIEWLNKSTDITNHFSTICIIIAFFGFIYLLANLKTWQ